MNFSRKTRAVSLVLVLALLVCMLPPFDTEVKAAGEYYITTNNAVVVIAPGFQSPTGVEYQDGDTIHIQANVFSVTVKDLDVNLIFGKYVPGGTNTGVTIDRRTDPLWDSNPAAEALYNAGVTLGWDRVDNNNSTYYVPTAPFLVTGDASVNALFYGSCTFYAGTNGVYVWKYNNQYYTYTENSSWYRGGYAGIQVDGDASLTITNADDLEAYGAYQSTRDPSNYNGGPSGSSDRGAAGGAGIGGGVAYNTRSSALNPDNNNRAEHTGGYYQGTPGNITILNGNVYARGGHLAAGVGGGHNSAATRGSIKLLGGNITAQGGAYAAGIGEGDSHSGATSPVFTESDYSIVIGNETAVGETPKHLNVVAKGGFRAAGIGTTDELSHVIVRQSGLSIEIFSGNVTATSGLGDANSTTAAIGAGQQTDMQGNNITVHAAAVISAASFADYAITNHGVKRDDLPVVNLDPNAYMFLARFDEYDDSERIFHLYAVKHIKIGEKKYAVLVDKTLEDIKKGNLTAAEFYAYDRELDQYFKIDSPDATALGEALTPETSPANLTHYFNPASIRTYTVPAKYRSIALTLPSPDEFGGAYVLESPYDTDKGSTFSVIEKYDAGVTSGRVQWENDYSLEYNATDFEYDTTHNMILDAIADPLIDLRVGLSHSEQDIENNLVQNFKGSTYGYTMYVPEDSDYFYLDFKYAENDTDVHSLLVDTKRVIWRSGDISIDADSENEIGTDHYTLGGEKYFFYEFAFPENADKAEIWVRKTDHAAVGTPTYVVYKVTVIKKHEHALMIDVSDKVYDKTPASVSVTAMTEEPIGFVPTFTMLPSTLTRNPTSEISSEWENSKGTTQTLIDGKTIAIGYLDENGDPQSEDFKVWLRARRFEGSPVLEFITTIVCAHGHMREVGTSFNLLEGRITHYGDTHSTLGHAVIDVGARGINPGNAGQADNGTAFVQIVCHDEEYPLWSFNFQFLEGHDRSQLTDDARVTARNAMRQKALDWLGTEGSPNHSSLFADQGTYVKGPATINTNLAVTLNVGGTTSQQMTFKATNLTVNGNFSYTARYSNGGDQHAVPAGITYTYYYDKANDKHVDTGDLDIGNKTPVQPPVDAGNYFVIATYTGSTSYDAYGEAAFTIHKRELVVEGVSDWLTQLTKAEFDAITDTMAPYPYQGTKPYTYSYRNIVPGDTVALNPDIAVSYIDSVIGYNDDKIMLKLAVQDGVAVWLPTGGANQNHNYQITSAVSVDDGAAHALYVPGELAYEVSDHIFRKSGSAYWQKHWPTWGEAIQWKDYNTSTGISSTPVDEETVDYHSPNNVTHRNLIMMRAVNKGASENRYAVDLEVGPMSFKFTKEIWNVNTHQYEAFDDGIWSGMTGENNQIQISNHSNRDIWCAINVELDRFHGQGISAAIYTDPALPGGTKIADLGLKTDLYEKIPWDDPEGSHIEGIHVLTRYLVLEGVPQNPAVLGTGGTGTIIITISPHEISPPSP